MVSVIFFCAAICIGEMSSKVSFLFCSAPDGAFRVQTAAAARACVRNLKPWVPTVPVERGFWGGNIARNLKINLRVQNNTVFNVLHQWHPS